MTKVIMVHGIGNYHEGWSKPLRVAKLLGIPTDAVDEVVYDDIFDTHWINLLLRPFAVWKLKSILPVAVLPQEIWDYAVDILLYFIPSGPRKRVVERVVAKLNENPGAIVLAHSLGSLASYEATFKTIEPFTLVTIGSPLGSVVLRTVVKRCLGLDLDEDRPPVKDWVNLYGTLDPIGGYIRGMGCENKDQYSVLSSHSLPQYLSELSKLPWFKKQKEDYNESLQS